MCWKDSTGSVSSTRNTRPEYPDGGQVSDRVSRYVTPPDSSTSICDRRSESRVDPDGPEGHLGLSCYGRRKVPGSESLGGHRGV